MERVNIDRCYKDNFVIGFGEYAGFNFVTLELPYMQNMVNISSIHPGIYKARKYNSPSFNCEVILLEDVPNRSWIEFHPGNYTYQIKGCILPGDGFKFIDSDDIIDVTNSSKTLNKLLELLPEQFEISIM